jgi:hypothetical protein
MAMDETTVRVFVVRLWFEPTDEPDQDPEWRGEVEHVMTGRIVYFRQQDGIVEALRKLCADPV